MGKLYIVATPIGNLEDITLRALRILKEADLILGEDTRVTKKLLEHYSIGTKILSYHQHSTDKEINNLVNLINSNKATALVTDAGSPGLSDPGGKLIMRIKDLGLRIEPIPGPSALTALISVAGIDLHEFLFLGFLPNKKGRQTLVKKIIESDIPVIVYESVYRVEKLLDELGKFGLSNERQLIIGRELTKKFETIYRGNLEEIKKQLTKDQVKGEFVVIINTNNSRMDTNIHK